MRAPRRGQPWARGFRWDPPDKEWLEYHYIELGKSGEDIAAEVGCGSNTARRWVRSVGIPLRRCFAHMTGETNPNWVDGKYAESTYHESRKVQYAKDVPQNCSWCGRGWEGLRSLHVHHKDHNKYNNTSENLMWLCRACHELETALWHLVKQNKIDLKCEGNTMVIMFKKGESCGSNRKI